MYTQKSDNISAQACGAAVCRPSSLTLYTYIVHNQPEDAVTVASVCEQYIYIRTIYTTHNSATDYRSHKMQGIKGKPAETRPHRMRAKQQICLLQPVFLGLEIVCKQR